MKKNKKTIWIIVLAFAVLLGGAYALYSVLGQQVETQQLAAQNGADDQAEQSGQGSESGEEPVQAPDFTVYDAEGNAVKLYDYIGKPIVLNFWASWCGPCRSEMSDFNDVYGEMGQDVQFLMVNMTSAQEPKETAMAFIEEQGYSFPVLYDVEEDAAIVYGIYSLPTTLFINGEGFIEAHASGAIDRQTLQEGIDMIR